MVPRVLRSAAALFPLAAALAVLSATAAEAHAAKKYALLMGVNVYDHRGLPPLDYAVADVAQLRDVLARAGYEVVLLTADEAKGKKDKALAPTKANFEAKLKALVKKFAKGDTLLIGLAGHGLQFAGDEDGYFCPVDTRPFANQAKTTMVSIKWVYDRLGQDAADGVKLVLVDACRNNPKLRERGIDADSAPQPPRGVGVLVSCAGGQFAHESEMWGGGHGVFFHHVLEGLKGEAKDKKGAVTWDDLRKYVKEQVPKDQKDQTPEESGRLTGVPVLIDAGTPKAARKGGEEQVVDLGGGVKMTFCWVPPGEATLGSPATEKGRGDGEKEHEYTSRGFWLAKYPVTQEQWQALTGKNPSYFQPTQDKIKEAGIKDTSRFPVESVSWDACQGFLKKMSAVANVPAGIGRGKFVLPDEDEWEYACRGGKGNKQPFYFGEQLKGDLANCDRIGPDGSVVTGYCKYRTTKVGSYEEKAPHPWGLCDMHGNVWQWCRKREKDEKVSVTRRGGSYYAFAVECRAACRGPYVPKLTLGDDTDIEMSSHGCRVCFRPD